MNLVPLRRCGTQSVLGIIPTPERHCLKLAASSFSLEGEGWDEGEFIRLFLVLYLLTPALSSRKGRRHCLT